MSIFSRNIRTVLTLKYTLVVALLMLIYSGINLGYQYYYLNKQLDLDLKEDFEIVQEILATNKLIINPLHYITNHYPKPYERFVEIWSDSGTVLYHSAAFEFEQFPSPPDIKQYTYQPQYFSLQSTSGKQWRTIAAIVSTPQSDRIVRISMDKDYVYSQLFDIFLFMTYLTPLFLIVAVSTGYFLARQALKPIDVMVIQLKRINTKNLDERLTILNPNDELGNLAMVINELLNRIKQAFEQLKNFTADASHELRTPLTAMRSVGEVGLLPGQPAEYYREVIGSMLEENARLTRLVDSLLLLSKADSGRIEIQKEKLDLLPFIKESIELVSILAEEKRQKIQVEGKQEVYANVDKILFRQALLNLIDNAIKYTPVDGIIILRNYLDEAKLPVIEVADNGPGIPQEHQGKIFDRFYRVEKDRSRETGGAGLGLAIVQWVVSVHQGDISVESSSSGTLFRIKLPQAQ